MLDVPVSAARAPYFRRAVVDLIVRRHDSYGDEVERARARVENQRADGEEFAAGKDFKPSTLTYWACQLRRLAPEGGGASEHTPPVRMVQVVGKASTSPAEDTLLVAVGAARIVLRPGFDRALLRDVVQALGDAR